MKKMTLLLILLFAFVQVSFGQTDIWTHTFETSGGYSTSIAEYTDTGTDYFKRTDGSDISSTVSLTNPQGSFFFGAQDIDSEGASLPVTLTFDDVDISSFSDLIFYVYLAEDASSDGNQDWDAADSVHIKYDIDNSGIFTELIWIESSGGTNTQPAIDANFDGIGEGALITSAFAEFSNTIIGTGSLIDIKVTLSLNSGDEDIALDNFRLAGTPASGTPVLTVSPSSLSGFEYVEGSGPSSEQTFTVSGSDLTNDISITPSTNYEISTASGGSFVSTDPITLSQSGGSVAETTIYTRLKAGLSAADYNSEDIAIASTGATSKTVTCSGTIYKTEPTNHVTSFTSIASNSTTIDLSWIDAGDADGYLIRANKVNTFSSPVDGTEEADATDSNGGTVNVAQGNGSYSWVGLDASTQYYFKIWPYTNSGSNINYKIDGTVPTTNATTDVAPSTPDLIITEIIQNPSAVLDDVGEWFEIYNNEDIDVDIDGYTIKDAGSDSHVINNGGALTIPTKGFIVLGINSDAATNGGLTVHYQYSGIALGNSDDEVILVYTDGVTVVDEVYYDGGTNFPDPTGSSMILTDFTSDNNVGSNWAESTIREGSWIATSGDNGSPGDIGSESVLPVELTSFTANVTDGGVVLNWTTATEVNNYGFEIEASTSSANNWENIGFVEGHGNSNSPKEYSFFDNSGATSYRLKQIDTDGAFEYSDVVTVAGALSKTELFQNHPNPFNPSTQISFSLVNPSQVNISVYNMLGQKVAELVNENMNVGTHNVEFDASNLASGFYFYRLETASFTQTMKMLLIK